MGDEFEDTSVDTGADIDTSSDMSDSSESYDDSSMDAGDESVEDSGSEGLDDSGDTGIEDSGESFDDSSMDAGDEPIADSGTEGLDDSSASDESFGDAEEPVDDAAESADESAEGLPDSEEPSSDTEEPIADTAPPTDDSSDTAAEEEDPTTDDTAEDLPDGDAEGSDEPADENTEATDDNAEDLPDEDEPTQDTDNPADENTEAADENVEELPDDGEHGATDEPVDQNSEAEDDGIESLPEQDEPSDETGEAADNDADDLPDGDAEISDEPINENADATDSPTGDGGSPYDSDDVPSDTHTHDNASHYKDLNDYMNQKNYGKDDFDTYSQDPEWQQLHDREFPGWYDQHKTDNAGADIPSGGYDLPADCKLVNASDIDMSDAMGMDDPNFWNHHGNTKEDYMDLARNLPAVQERLDRGESLDNLYHDPDLGATANQYYNPKNMVHVEERPDGSYGFMGDGRHRVTAAQELGHDMPVKVDNYQPNDTQSTDIPIEAGTNSDVTDTGTAGLPEGNESAEVVDSHANDLPDEQPPQSGTDFASDNSDDAYQKLNQYMCDHNYGINDYGTYSQDPEWQNLHQKAFPDHYDNHADSNLSVNDLPPDDGTLSDSGVSELPNKVDYDDVGKTSDFSPDAYKQQSANDARDLNHKQRDALDGYSKDDYRKINDSLRGKDVSFSTPSQKERINDQINTISDTLDGKELPEDMTLYRGLNEPKFLFGDGYADKSLEQLRQENIGKVVYDDGFCSTSTDRRTAQDFANSRNGAVMEISAPKGANGMCMHDVSAFSGENEVLLHKGSGFRIDDINYDRYNGYTINASLIGRRR